MANLTATWVVLGIGLLLWFLGLVAGPRRGGDSHPPRGNRGLSLLGIAFICLGLYAGFKGPLTRGPITLKRFSFATGVSKAAEEARAYARGKLTLTSRPAPGWHGGSKTVLEFTVRNSGTRSVAWVTLRLRARSGSGSSSADLRLRGPFRAKQTSKSVLTIPGSVDRAYFKAPGVTAEQIVAARF